MLPIAVRAALLAGLLVATLAHAADVTRRADPLAAIDSNRNAIIRDIVRGFEAADGGTLAPRLAKLRADRLLAASLASTRESLEAILAESQGTTAPGFGTLREKALGDVAADLVYTPLTPCRLIDTRGFGAPIQGGFFAPNARRAYIPQGLCSIPSTGVASLLISFTTQNLTPTSGGYLAILAPGAPVTASVDVFNLGSEWSASNTAVSTGGAGQFDVLVAAATAHVVIDVLGYFRAPSGTIGDITAVSAGTGLSGGGASGDVALAIAGPYQLPQACSANQVPKWSGTSWNCAADNAGTASTVLLGGNASGATGVIGTTDAQAFEIVTQGARSVRYEPSALLSGGMPNNVNVIAGSRTNTVTAGVRGAVIAGGGIPSGANEPNLGFFSAQGPNRVFNHYGVVGGGMTNHAGLDDGAIDNSSFATVGGGRGNSASGYASAIAGGSDGTANGPYSAIAGGYNNFTDTQGFGFIGGGSDNVVSAYAGVVAGGVQNAAGTYAMVPGGQSNNAPGAFSFAAGRGANARIGAAGAAADGTFVWADSNGGLFSATADFYAQAGDEFAVRARGGVRLRTSSDLSTGCNLAAGSGTWACTSDRHAKEGIKPVSAREVLAKVVTLPMSTWRFKGTSDTHMGPMAQDFRAAFGLGQDERTITHVDGQGVALAAIQGLYQLLAERDRRLDALEGELRVLRARFAP